MVVGVLVELSSKNIDKIFDYSVPLELMDKIKVGIRVEVPFGRQTLDGFVLEIKDSSEVELKNIISIKDNDIVLNDELLLLGKIMKSNTLATLISCYQVMLPKALKAKIGGKSSIRYEKIYHLNNIDITKMNFSDKQREIIDLCLEKGNVKRSELVSISLSSLNTLIKKEVLCE